MHPPAFPPANDSTRLTAKCLGRTVAYLRRVGVRTGYRRYALRDLARVPNQQRVGGLEVSLPGRLGIGAPVLTSCLGNTPR